MTEDARFEDAGARPLNLGALDTDDLQVLSALLQDAVFPIAEMRWQPRKRRLGILVNRLRREDGARRAAPERVQTLLVIDNVMAVSSQGIDRKDTNTILSLWSVGFEPIDDVSGHVLLTLAPSPASVSKT